MAKDVEENVLQTSKRSLTYEGSNVKPVAITSEVFPLASDTEEFNLDGSVSKPNASAFGVPGKCVYHSAIRIPMKLANEIRRINAEFRFSHFNSYFNGNQKLSPNFDFQF